MKPSFSQVATSVALLAVVALSCSKSGEPNRAVVPEKPRPVRVARVESRAMERTAAGVGSLVAQDQATLSVKVPGRLHSISVDLGSLVKKGDLLAQVDPQDYELRVKQSVAALAQSRASLGLSLEGDSDTVDIGNASVVKQAKALLDEAAKNRERAVSLSKSGIAPQSEVDTVESAYIVALNKHDGAIEEARTRQATLAQRRAELEIAQKQLKDTSLRAPFDGAIQSRAAGLGEYLQAGTPVVMIVRTDPLRLRLEVPERDAAGVRSNQVVCLRVEGAAKTVAGRIARVSPAITEQSRMLIVEADIPNDGSLRPGLFVRGEIVTNDHDEGLAVPSAALINFAGLEKVVTVLDGKALEKIVTTGRKAGNWVEIVSGLKAGERVVIEPGNLRTGHTVTVTDSPPLQTSKAPTKSDP